MSLTNSQLNFLLREKAIHKNTQIKVEKCRTKKITDNYKVPVLIVENGKLSRVLFDDKNEKYYICYKKDESDKEKYCLIDEVKEIDGQSTDRFFKALEELLVNSNAYKITEPTNVASTLVGKKKPKLNGIELYEGMKIFLTNDKTQKYNNRVLNIKGYGTKVKLLCNAGRPKTRIDEGPKVKKKRGRKLGWRKNKTVEEK